MWSGFAATTALSNCPVGRVLRQIEDLETQKVKFAITLARCYPVTSPIKRPFTRLIRKRGSICLYGANPGSNRPMQSSTGLGISLVCLPENCVPESLQANGRSRNSNTEFQRPEKKVGDEDHWRGSMALSSSSGYCRPAEG
jgi:hypothetical protein